MAPGFVHVIPSLWWIIFVWRVCRRLSFFFTGSIVE